MRIYRIDSKSALIAIAIVSVAAVVAISTGLPNWLSDSEVESDGSCISGEYVITKSAVALRDDKSLQLIESADESSYRLVDQSRSAMLV
jgi:hypothetical protein